MATITQFATVSETGILQINPAGRKRMQADLKKFAGKSVEISIKVKNRRSTQQNRYYFGVVVKEIEIELRRLGNDVDSDTVHEFLKDRFNKKELIGEGGEVIDHFPGSTTAMSKSDFCTYIDKIIFWAAEFLMITIPAPDTELQLQF